MATYAKILKDNAGNQILPYTRAKLVYMDDNTTVQDAVLQPATNAQMGRVLIGNNLEYDGNGTISLSKSGVCNALGYTPSVNESFIQENTFDELKNNRQIIGDLARIDSNNENIDYLSGDIKITRIHAKIWFVHVKFSSSKDIIAYTGIDNSYPRIFTITMRGIAQSFNSSYGPSERMVFPIIAGSSYQSSGNDGLVGQLYVQSNSGGHQSTILFGMDKTIPANTNLLTNFYLYDFTYAKS